MPQCKNADVLCLSFYVLLLFSLCIKYNTFQPFLTLPPRPASLLSLVVVFVFVFVCMDFGKQGSWDSSNSSDELYEPQDHQNHQQHLKDEMDTDNDPTKRPYECTFCKRGFTNAQALGGHMNIHRKDRAKAKHNRNFIHKYSSSNSSSSSSQYSQNNNNDHLFSPLISTTQPTTAYYPPPPSNNYRMYFDTAAANYPIHHHTSPTLNQDQLLGANLSLQIDQTTGVWKNEELDLELRLGHEYR